MFVPYSACFDGRARFVSWLVSKILDVPCALLCPDLVNRTSLVVSPGFMRPMTMWSGLFCFGGIEPFFDNILPGSNSGEMEKTVITTCIEMFDLFGSKRLIFSIGIVMITHERWDALGHVLNNSLIVGHLSFHKIVYMNHRKIQVRVNLSL